MLDLDARLPTLLRDVEGPVLRITFDFDFRVVRLAADETLGVEDSVLGVGVESVLHRVTITILRR